MNQEHRHNLHEGLPFTMVTAQTCDHHHNNMSMTEQKNSARKVVVVTSHHQLKGLRGSETLQLNNLLGGKIMASFIHPTTNRASPTFVPVIYKETHKMKEAKGNRSYSK
ncbi:hypothetical protein Bca101_064089 [Brassica carinata]